jgi:hypothetical protein
VAEVKEGDLFRVECIDWTGGQIKDDDSAEDMKNVDLSVIHVRLLVWFGLGRGSGAGVCCIALICTQRRHSTLTRTHAHKPHPNIPTVAVGADPRRRRRGQARAAGRPALRGDLVRFCLRLHACAMRAL